MLYAKCDELSYRTMGTQQSIDETFPPHTVQEIPYKLFQYISFFLISRYLNRHQLTFCFVSNENYILTSFNR